mmetsp:Transcript_28580/g.65846  ORF Transcript_28580/g.65846 Transcript_28580/m.65846 type:complete len:239 (+) Transcript_28580:75-791(+)|eukprot:CAMPEP_0114552920 /NCGR_PEP_ID=MMETSP0114-20121206/7378_1 /TAXON_ID=31324 /ORGANISM="Goniomonas sp, Strain m" /LENGTH=238 /DNA_ID=CAMNT_0001737821 /DNA_START=67 /DNA_END=783 /DNA_ORIENTATION=-
MSIQGSQVGSVGVTNGGSVAGSTGSVAGSAAGSVAGSVAGESVAESAYSFGFTESIEASVKADELIEEDPFAVQQPPMDWRDEISRDLGDDFAVSILFEFLNLSDDVRALAKQLSKPSKKPVALPPPKPTDEKRLRKLAKEVKYCTKECQLPPFSMEIAMQRAGLEQYHEKVNRYSTEWSDLQYVSERDLKKVGIRSRGVRRQLIKMVPVRTRAARNLAYPGEVAGGKSTPDEESVNT